MNNISKTFNYSSLDIPKCVICLDTLATPVQLGCGHIFDLDCIAQWFYKAQTCPLDRCPIDGKKIIYRSDLIEKVSATFHFKFLSSFKIDPIVVNIYSPVQKLKAIVAYTPLISESDPVQAAFAPYKSLGLQPNNRNLICILNHESGNKTLYSDTSLSEYPLEVGKSYNIATSLKLAQYGLPCDHCYGNPEKEKACNHED